MAADHPEISAHEENCYTEMSAIRQHCAVCWRRPACDTDGWCNHLTEYVNAGNDARELDFGVTFQVPIQPSKSMFVMVGISDDSIADICAPINLMVEDLFTNDVNLHPLGLWTKGEGMMSIRNVVLDWIKGRAKIEKLGHMAECPSSSHGFKDIQAMRDVDDSLVLWHNLAVALYGLCLPEYEKFAATGNSALVPPAGGNTPDQQAVLNRLGQPNA